MTPRRTHLLDLAVRSRMRLRMAPLGLDLLLVLSTARPTPRRPPTWRSYE
jgi:hypothetical protein